MSSERILIVDDSATQLEAARALLAGGGYEVTAVTSGAEALAEFERTAFDLVLSDVLMPEMNGFELCSAIKRRGDDAPPIVLLTSLADPRDIVRGVECGADNYITKPYEPDHLLQRIAYVLANQRLRREVPAGGRQRIEFHGETYTVPSDPARILNLLLSSFDELIRTNAALQESKHQLAEAHARELQREQEARGRAEADSRRMEVLKRKAEAATRARDEVLATVSHDLKNPIGTIFTSASLLLDMPLPPDARQRQLEIIRRTAGRMNRLIQDLLDVSRMEAGGFTIETEPIDVRMLMAEARDMLGTLAAPKGIRTDVRQPPHRLLVDADRDRVLQVLSNLIGNAVKFTPENGTVSIRATEAGDTVEFSIADTGTGIREEDLPHIFERFWQSGEAGGSGLGLAIARGIVTAHGGSIGAENREEGGALFRFTLPLARLEAGLATDFEGR